MRYPKSPDRRSVPVNFKGPDNLTANGVRFERYDQAKVPTDEKGIAVLGTSKGAWFKDPDGNTLGLLQG